MRTKSSEAVARGSTAKAAKRPAAGSLLVDVREMIRQARAGVARAVESGLVALYWHIGRRIRQDILQEKRAGYGERIVAALGRRLEQEFGRGFAEKNLRRMIQFAEAFPDAKIVVTLSRQLGWSHFVAIIPIADSLKRDFYAEMCRIERWNKMRIARGTLADSKTTIQELWAWEFNGPFLDDFTGRRRPSDGGCAGAISEEAP